MFTAHAIWALIHGLALGGLFIVASAAYSVAIFDLGSVRTDGPGFARRLGIMKLSGWAMAVVAWVVVLLGTFVVMPWYRASPPEGATDLSAFPRSYLRADPALSGWHLYGMEWKEYLGWLVPILVTVVAVVTARWGRELAADRTLRRTVLTLMGVAFVAAAVSGAIGALLTRVAPIP